MDSFIHLFFINYIKHLHLKASPSMINFLSNSTLALLLQIIKTADLYCRFQNKSTITSLEIQRSMQLLYTPFFQTFDKFPLIIGKSISHSQSLVIKSSKENVFNFQITSTQIKEFVEENLDYAYKTSKDSIVFIFGLLTSFGDYIINMALKENSIAFKNIKMNDEEKFVFAIIKKTKMS